MSASPDDPSWMTGITQGLSSPFAMLMLNLMKAGAPSRMPQTLGGDAAQAYGDTLQQTGQVQANQAQAIQLQRNAAYLKALRDNLNPDQSQQPPAAPPAVAGAPNSPEPSIAPGNSLLTPAAPPAAPIRTSSAGGNPLLGSPQGAPQNPLAAPGGSPASDPILQDKELQRDLSLSNMAPDATTQTAWLTRARLRYDTLAGTPAYKSQVEQATAAADLPFKVRESMAGQLGRVTSINPGEGQIAVSGLSLASPQLVNWLSGGDLMGQGGGGGAPQGGAAAPAAGGGPAVPAPRVPAGAPAGDMSGVPTPFVATPGGGGINTQGAVYQTALQKKLADEDATYLTGLQTSADSATNGRQNVEQMWQAYHGGILTGKFADFKENFLKGASALGVPIGSLNDTLSNTESFTKNQAQLGISLAKSVSSRPSQFEFKYLNSNAVANPNLQQASVPLLLSQMEGNQVYAQQKAQYVNIMAEKGINPRKAALDFDTNASSMPYVLTAMASRDPQTYRTLRAQMQSNETGKAFEKQVEREAAWMKAQGLLQAAEQPAAADSGDE